MDIRIQAVEPNVQLIHHTPFPLETLWLSFRTCYSPDSPQYLWENRPERETMVEFIDRRLKTEHRTPTEHVTFTFAISGVSRSLTHQLVRHRSGWSFAQQSGRYTDPIDNGVFEYVEAPSIDKIIGTDSIGSEPEMALRSAIDLYQTFIDAGIPREDARMYLPQSQASNVVATVNFSALQHFCDIRLCTLAQWEIRKLANLMRMEVKKVAPELGDMLKIKCMEGRKGACDEDYSNYQKCGLSATRPHVQDLSRVI